MNPYLEKFIALGWSVFPLRDSSKRPAVKWEKYLTQKPDEEELAEWRAKNYNNYAVVCGAVSGGLVILDFESAEDARAFFNKWDNLLAKTLVVETPHKGIHVYLITDKPPQRRIRIFGNEHPVDLLGEGGYAVAPGSVIDCPEGDCNEGTRGVYRIISQADEPALMEARELQKMLITRSKELGWRLSLPEAESGVAVKEATGALPEETIAKVTDIISRYWVKGSRNHITITLCGALIKNGVGVESAREIIQRVCDIKSDPEAPEFIKTVEYEYQPKVLRKERLTGLPTLREIMKSINPQSAEKDWQELLSAIKPQEETPGDLARRIADYLMREYEIVTMADSDEIYIRTDGIFTNDEAFIKKVIEQEFRDEKITNHVVEEVFGHIRRNTYTHRSFFDMPPELIPLKNGVLNVITGEFREYGPDDHFVTNIPVDYDPNADAPMFKKFVSEIVYPEDIPTLQEFFGYTLWRGMPAQVALMLVGEGANGKSTLLTILKAMLGAHNVTSFAIQELESDKFLRGALYGKLANIRSELPSVALRDTGIFKHLTGGDPLSADVKFGKYFTFVNYAKLIFATNKIPKSPDDTDAFFRRWIIISFPFKFSQHPDPSKGEKLADPTLAQKIIKNELPGVLNWALEGLKRLMANNWKFSSSKSTEETRLDYLRKSDPIKAFFEDAIIINKDASVVKAELYRAYVKYCTERKLTTVSDVAFFKGLAKLGVDVNNTAFKRIDGKAVRVLKGVELLPPEKWGKKEEEEENESAQSPEQNEKIAEMQSASENKQAVEEPKESKSEQTAEQAKNENAQQPSQQENKPESEQPKPAQGEGAEPKPGVEFSCNIKLPEQILQNLKPDKHGCKCKLCNAGPWTDPKAILAHFNLAHKELGEKPKSANLLACPVCGAKFFTQKDLDEHMQIHAENQNESAPEADEDEEVDENGDEPEEL